MSLFDEIFPDLATEMVAEFGTDAVLTVLQGEYDTVTGTEFPDSTVISLKVLPPSTFDQYQMVNIGLEVGEILLYTAGSYITTTLQAKQCRLEYDGTTYVVNKIMPIKSGEFTPLYGLVIRTHGS